MEAPITPRVNSSSIQRYPNRTVRLVGKVVQMQGSHAIIEASDKGQVNVSIPPECMLGSNYVEIIGQVQPDGSLQAFSTIDFGNNFDLGVYENLIQKASKYSQLFE